MRVIKGKLSWMEAAEILGVIDRTMHSLRDRTENGSDGPYDYSHNRPGPKRRPATYSELERVLKLYREKYFDLNIRRFYEKLTEVEKVEVSYLWVQRTLKAAGLPEKRRKRS